MSRGLKKGVAVSTLAFFLFSSLSIMTPGLFAQDIERGSLVGYIFDRDGKTPILGAVIKVRNITSGAIYESLPTDAQGLFKIDGLAKGIYTFGITTELGDFNSSELVGILANETTKVSISLNPYDSGVQSAVQEVIRDQVAVENEGESRIGRVVRYDPNTNEAEVYIERGLIQIDDRIHIKGVNTNFYQGVGHLRVGENRIRRALAGESPWLAVKGPVQTGDIVYVVCNKGILPFFLTPCGIAWVIAGSGAIMAGIIEITDKTPLSPFKK